MRLKNAPVERQRQNRLQRLPGSMSPNRPLQNQTQDQLPRAGETPALQIQSQRQRRPPQNQKQAAATNSKATATA